MTIDREIGPRGYDPYNHNPYGNFPLMGRQWTRRQLHDAQNRWYLAMLVRMSGKKPIARN